MSRSWVKLSAGIYRHPEIGLVSDGAFRRFVECIALAGDSDDDDDGRVGSWAGVARLLHVSEEQLRKEVAELDGRLEDRGGVLFVRDWCEWQAEKDWTNAERQARFRARRKAEEEGNVTSNGSNGVTGVTSNTVTTVTGVTGVTALDKIREEENREEKKEELEVGRDSGVPSARPHAHTPARGNGLAAVAADEAGASDPQPEPSPFMVLDWTPFYADCGELWGVDPMRQDGKGAKAWAGQLAHAFGRFAGNDVATARRLLASWSHSADFAYAKQPTLSPPKAVHWLNENADFVLAVES